MPNQGPNSTGAGATGGGSGATWVNPNNILTPDDVYATCNLTSTLALTEYLISTNYGFSIPPTAIITGIWAEWQLAISAGTGRITQAFVTLNGSASVGTDLFPANQSLTTLDSLYSRGGDGQVFGNVLTGADVNLSTFGVKLEAQQQGATLPVVVRCDHSRMTIWYVVGGSLVPKPPQYRIAHVLVR